MHSIAIYIFILMSLLMDNYHLNKRCGHQECNNYTVFPSLNVALPVLLLPLHTEIETIFYFQDL